MIRTILILIFGILFSFEVFSETLVCQKKSCNFYGNHPVATYGKNENSCTYLEKKMIFDYSIISKNNFKWFDRKNYVNCNIKMHCENSYSTSNYSLKDRILKIRTFGFVGEKYGDFSMESEFNCELKSESLKYAKNINSSTQEIDLDLPEEQFCNSILNELKKSPPFKWPSNQSCVKLIRGMKNGLGGWNNQINKLVTYFDVLDIKSYNDYKIELDREQKIKNLKKCKENFISENFFNSSKNYECFPDDTLIIKMFANSFNEIVGLGISHNRKDTEMSNLSQQEIENVEQYYNYVSSYVTKGSVFRIIFNYNKQLTEMSRTYMVPLHFKNNKIVINDFNQNKTIIASNSNNTKPSISSSELKKEKTKRLEEEQKRKALEKRIAELEKKNKELQQPKKQQKAKPKSGSGSGFFISKLGHIITNQHVVNKCKKITIGDHIDKQVPAKLLETDSVNDLALLRTTNLKMASAETQSLLRKLSIEIIPLASGGLMRKSEVKGGEDVIVAGFPYGVRFGTDIKVTFGNVNSTKGIGDDSSQFQIQAPVQPGNSGGPIYDRYGNIVGVVVSQLNKFKLAKSIGSLPENVNFGIKASTVRQFLNTSGVITNYSKRTKPVSNEKMFELASKQTVMVVCHR